jgi:hypothetical protein
MLTGALPGVDDAVIVQLAAQRAAESSNFVTHPLFIILAAVALIIVCGLGPLSRMHERRSQLKDEQARRDAEQAGPETSPPADRP